MALYDSVVVSGSGGGENGERNQGEGLIPSLGLHSHGGSI